MNRVVTGGAKNAARPAARAASRLPGKGKVYVVDDDPAMLTALSRLVRSAGFGVATYSSAPAFIDEPPEDVPCCLVLDLSLPGPSGLDLQETLQRQGREIPIIFITGHGDISSTVRALKAGALDFLEKPFTDEALLGAIRAAVDRGEERRAESRERAAIQQRFDTLTPREREVMALVVRGLLNKQTARELGAAETTVKVHRGRVMAKMGAQSVPDLVRMAQKIGIRATRES